MAFDKICLLYTFSTPFAKRKPAGSLSRSCMSRLCLFPCLCASLHFCLFVLRPLPYFKFVLSFVFVCLFLCFFVCCEATTILLRLVHHEVSRKAMMPPCCGSQKPRHFLRQDTAAASLAERSFAGERSLLCSVASACMNVYPHSVSNKHICKVTQDSRHP